ncbi:MAG: YheT family hydrolase [Desulfopila sp.]
MPVLSTPDYTPRFPFTIGHVQTLYPTLFRPTPVTTPIHERIELDDGDFLDIDWHYHRPHHRSSKLAVISHGLEGNSRKKNMLGMAAQFTDHGWDVICLNFRGCSEEMNRLPRLYHSGVTDDLHTILSHGLTTGNYRHAALIGFSMGGNQTLKYLGEAPEMLPPQVKGAVVFSVPIQLADSGTVLDHWTNRIYMEYFMKGLREKIRIKAAMFPELYDTTGLAEMKTFTPFDDKYTGPIHGFSGAADYYAQCSSKQFLHTIRTPTLIVQAQDDPFLPASCYPHEEARQNDNIFLEIPRYGGHVGFIDNGSNNRYWLEYRAAAFLKTIQ